MNICIVSGIFEPESGGPATYAPRLAKELVALGHRVSVVAFCDKIARDDYPFQVVLVRRGNRLLNRFRFFFAALRPIRESACVYMLDHFAAGLPASLAARLYKKPYIVRIGGDYLWEQRYLESGQDPISLQEFYKRDLYRRREYAPYAKIIWRVLSYASRIVFNADRLRDLYIQYWDIAPARSSVIYNPVPTVEIEDIRRGEPSKEFVFWGRFIVMKNVTTLVRAFAVAQLPEGYTLTLIGDGPRKSEVEGLVKELGIERRVTILPGMPLLDVLRRVKDARAFVLPSWTDISPNQVYEALAIGLPALVTEENYLSIAELLPRTIDPSSQEDIARALEALAHDGTYGEFSRQFRAIRFDNTWSSVAAEHAKLFEKVL